MNIAGFDHLNLTVADFDKTVDWYHRIFGFVKVEEDVDEEGGRWGVIRSGGGRGETMLCIYESPGNSFEDGYGRDERGFHSIKHMAFRIRDREAWLQTIEREKLEFELRRWPHSTGWYVEDPTGYEIEVVLWDGDKVDFSGRPVGGKNEAAAGR